MVRSSINKETKPSDISDYSVRFEDTIKFFRERAPIVFVSQHYKFWEHHGFVQQSLARVLTDAGVPVIWFDGANWRKKRVIQSWHSPLLKVLQLPSIPLRRISIFESINPKVQVRAIKKALALGPKPFLWIQTGLDERVVSELPYIDVFSVFDDPYIHSPNGELSKKSDLIVVQNDFARQIFQKNHPDKTIVLYPPVEMSPSSFTGGGDFHLPEGFPTQVMGYVGSFFSSGFDLVMFEDFVRSLPDWGFLLCGRTDSLGSRKIRHWTTQYPNFVHLPWVPRTQVGAVWRKLKLNLMLYRPEPASHGAFPVKLLEALYYRIPSVTTVVPKTSSLEGLIPQWDFPEQFKSEAIKEANSPSQTLEKLYEYFSSEMDPKLHLIRVKESLLARKT